MSKRNKILIFLTFIVAFVASFWLLYIYTVKDTDAGENQKEYLEKRDSAHKDLPQPVDF